MYLVVYLYWPVWGKHHGTNVAYCLSAGSHDLPSAHEHTPRRDLFLPRPFFLSSWVYLLTIEMILYRIIGLTI